MALCLAAAGLASCGGSGGDDASTSGRDRDRAGSPARPPSSASPRLPMTGGVQYAPAAPDPVVTRVNRRCRRSVRPLASTAAVSSLAERAARARREHARLRRISRALAATARRGRIPRPLRRYRAAIKDQMFLEARIERAAKEGDALAVGVGLRQNRFNQRRRQQLADELGLHACL